MNACACDDIGKPVICGREAFLLMSYSVYILKSLKDGTYYVGSTQSLSSRLERHDQGRARYTRNKIPWQLVYHEEHSDRSSAVAREREIKKRRSRGYIESLVRTFREG
jgi:putative endonuclease